MPLVNDEVIFIHNIKTGGTYLRACIDGKEVGNGHETAQQSKSFIESKAWNNRFKFAVVRNPYDLMLSLYHYFRKEKWHPNANSANGSFSEFLNIYANTLHGKGVYLQQFDKVSENGKIILDKVYRYEDWNEMTKELSDKFGYKFKAERINSSDRDVNDIKKSYVNKDVQIVNHLFEKDFSGF